MHYPLPPRCTPRPQSPPLTSTGIERAVLETSLYQAILAQHRTGKKRPEHVPGDFVTLHGTSRNRPTVASDLCELQESLKRQLHGVLQPQLEAWVGRALVPTFVYGIRTYRQGATLRMHRDKDTTHMVSAILHVDEVTPAPWPILMEGEAHGEAWHRVTMKPGELLFYESNRLMHGRPTPFMGSAHTGVYIHFALR